MNKCLFILTLLTAALLASVSFAGIDNTVAARGEGIGFGYSAIANDPFGALYNPSGTAYISNWQTQFQYQRPTRYGFTIATESPYFGMAGFNYHKDGLGNIGLNILQIGSTSNPTTITTTTDVVFTYARLLGHGLAAGANAKYLLETNFSDRKAFDFDFGLSYRPEANFALSASGENLLKGKLTPDWAGTTEHLARKLRLASAYFVPLSNILGSLVAGYQMTQAGELKTQTTSLMNAGTEWWFGTNSNVTLGMRAGYTFGKATRNEINDDYSRIHAGISVNYNLAGRDLRFDYGLRTYPYKSTEKTASDHSFSITYGFGGVPNYGKKHEAHKLTQSYKPQPPKQATPIVQTTPPVNQPKTEIQQQPTPPPAQPTIEIAAKPAVVVNSPAVNTAVVQTPKPVVVTPPVETANKPAPIANQQFAEVTTPMGNPTPAPVPIEKPKQTVAPINQPLVETPKPTAYQPPVPIHVEQPKQLAAGSHQITETTKLPGELAEKPTSPIVHGQGELAAKPANPPQTETPKTPVAQAAPVLAQNTEETAPIESKPITAVIPVNQQPITSADYMKLELGLDVSDISFAGETRIVFYLRPVRVIKLTSWKLYIFKAKLKDWDEQKAEAFAVHRIDGKGIPPINVIWNGLLTEGRMVPSGKYYFVIVGQDKFGQRFISDWCKFEIK